MEAKALEKLVTYYRENKISHAYLLETNNLEKCYSDLLTVIKKIFCQKEYKDNCMDCNICNLINQKYLPSLIVIEPNGASIKKEQIQELKKNFSSVPIYTTDNIYVIKEAEKLNDASANTMLKFLEEPEEHILGFFVTNNSNNVIPTIKSRCEILKVVYETSMLNPETITNEENKELYFLAQEYLKKIEVEKTESIMYNKDVLLSQLTDKEDITKLFKIILIIYEMALNKKLNLAHTFDKFPDLDFLLNLNSQELIKRIELVTTFLDDITTNVNKELLLDKFIIELGEING